MAGPPRGESNGGELCRARRSRQRRGDAADPRNRDQETLDRELNELSGELRTVVPAATVLLAFLLTVPFAAEFPTLSGRQRNIYTVAFLATAMSLVFLLAETAYHRVCGKPYDKGALVRTAGRQLVVGLVLIGVAIVAVVLLVIDVLFGLVAAVAIAAPLVLLAGVTWFLIPLRRRARRDEEGSAGR